MDAQCAVMTQAERTRFRRFLAACEERLSRDSAHLARLRRRLERAAIVEGENAPSNRACLNAQVLVRDLVSGRTHVETVVLPAEVEVAAGRRQLHSWSGPLLLGAREGDEVRWCWGETLKQWRIEKILSQPGSTPAFRAPQHLSQRRVREAPVNIVAGRRSAEPHRRNRWIHCP
ncbi:MAG: GreA/GreB family elongation factor [Gammaproteobacteria bacterium]